MATVTSGTLSYVLDEVTSAVMINQFVQLPNVWASIYQIRGSNKSRERVTSISGLGDFEEKVETQGAVEDAPIQQFQKTFNHTPFAKTVPVSRELVDDEDWGWFENLGMQLAMAASRTMESQAAGPFNDAFAGASYTTEGGLSLCNGAHVNSDGANSQSNSGTTALAHAAVNTARIAMKGFTDYRGGKMACMPSTLMVPDALEQTAWEIVRSQLVPGDNHNDANMYLGMFQLVVWSWLTDANNWFLIDGAQMSTNLLWYMRSGLETYGDGDLFTGKRRVGAYYRKSNGFVDWRWVYGMNVT